MAKRVVIVENGKYVYNLDGAVLKTPSVRNTGTQDFVTITLNSSTANALGTAQWAIYTNGLKYNITASNLTAKTGTSIGRGFSDTDWVNYFNNTSSGLQLGLSKTQPISATFWIGNAVDNRYYSFMPILDKANIPSLTGSVSVTRGGVTITKGVTFATNGSQYNITATSPAFASSEFDTPGVDIYPGYTERLVNTFDGQQMRDLTTYKPENAKTLRYVLDANEDTAALRPVLVDALTKGCMILRYNAASATGAIDYTAPQVVGYGGMVTSVYPSAYDIILR